METLSETVSAAPEELKLTPRMIEMLKQTTSWTRFLAIVGYVMVGFMVLAAFFMFGLDLPMDDTGMGAFGAGVGGVMYVIIALIYFFPVHYLYKFSSSMKRALADHDTQFLESGFDFLRKHYKFMGILTAVALIIYGIAFLFGIMAGVMAIFM
ncbi:hypothetical protein [Robertkochia sediminum]|uniref:hypothetical protein n=1 Tax=Robertkochia sediminum TaxID=2785326 RepID=UPI0019349E6D|nr:hypothetical protein [Robertkochia sediminum]MBL7472101.1 hypothetical protein [Robertkochia sediminum]